MKKLLFAPTKKAASDHEPAALSPQSRQAKASSAASASASSSTKRSPATPSNQRGTASEHEPHDATTNDEDGDGDAMAYAMAETLTPPQKRGLAGLCACLLPHVNDGSPEQAWAKMYLGLIVEQFLGLPSSNVEAFLPMLTARHEALEEYALSSAAEAAVAARSGSARGLTSPRRPPPILDKLDPAPFYALIMPGVGGGTASMAHGDGDEEDLMSKGHKKKATKGKWSSLLGKKPTANSEDNNDPEKRSDAEPTTPTSPRATKEEVVAFQLSIAKHLLWFTVKSIGYDARARTLLRVMADTMRLPWYEITKEEVLIGKALYAEATAMPMEKSAAKPSLWDWKRNATIGAAAVAGGALLALTGGLAAPAIATSLTALGGAGVAIGTAVGSAAGVTATTVLFGTAGAGVVGMKTDTRTRGVQQFHFDLVSTGDGMNVYICVSGWLDEDDPPARGFRRSWGDSREYLRAFYRTTNAEKVDQVDQVLDRYKGREDEFFGILRKTYRITDGSPTQDPLGLQADSKSAAMTGDEASAELMRAWRWKDRFHQGDQYCLNWEEEMLRKFGKSMRTFAKEQLMNYANNEIIQLTAFAALFAAVAIPRTLLRAADIIDNIWVLAMNRADESGKILAETLRRREQGLRPVTLVGYGMGARLIFSCLKKLAKYDDCFGIVENAVLLGTPLPVNAQDWRAARRVVSSRLINGYSENDWMLAIMYRYQGWALNSAGIGPVDISGVENSNLSSFIKGHMEYKSKIGVIMDHLNLEG